MAVRTPYRKLPLLVLACIASTTLHIHAQAVEATAPKTSQAVEPAMQPNKPPPPAPTADYRFVVIAIHPTPDGRLNHMPAPSPPDRFQSETISVAALAMKAFGLQHPYQLEYPQWTDNTYFSINATMPEGATQKDLPIMIQHLLEDRFGLVFHTKTKLMSGFEMIKVKPGPDITPSTGPVSSENGGQPLEVKNGVPLFNKDTQVSQFLTKSMEILRGRDKGMDSLAQNISSVLQAPVADSTGLTGKYDYTLTFTPQIPANENDPAPKYPFLFEALEQQLGIKLQPKKNVPVAIYVIDKALKTPSEN